MTNDFFAELARCLHKKEIDSVIQKDRRLEVILHGQPALFVTPRNEVFLLPEMSGSEEANDLYHEVAQAADEVFSYPTLRCLEGSKVNIDELDYLAKRLDGFDAVEVSQFQAMADKLKLTDMKDLINLTFSCQQATVIADFSDLESVGRAHYMNTHDGCASVEELDNLDGEETAILLIEDNEGTITRYGVVYDNGMQLSQLYDGKNLPCYHGWPKLRVYCRNSPLPLLSPLYPHSGRLSGLPILL